MPTNTEVVERHRAEMRAARAQMTDPFSAEATVIFAAITERHRLEWVERVNGTKAQEAAERKAEERVAKAETTPAAKGAPTAKAANLCEACGTVIPPTGKKGRPAKRCASCRAVVVKPAEIEAPKSQRVTILGPNLMIRDTTTFHVHAAGCADMKKRQYRGVISGGEHWTSEFSSLQDIVESTYDGQMSDNADDPEWSKWEAYESDFTFFPCVTLPREA